MSPFRLALSNLLHYRGRTLFAVLGMGAVVLLVFMELGFLDSVERTATLLYDHLDFDVLIVSSEFINLGEPGTVSRDRLAQARAVPGVQSVIPLTVVWGLWQPAMNRQPRWDMPVWSIMVLAVDPKYLEDVLKKPLEDLLARNEAEVKRSADLLWRSRIVLIDRNSKQSSFAGPDKFKSGALYELNGRRVEIGGRVNIGTSFSYSGLVLTSTETLEQVSGWPRNRVTYGLVKVSGMTHREAKRALSNALPSDVQVLTRDDVARKEKNFWLNRTPLGLFCFVGVVLSLLVGVVFVYQMMAADINRRLPEYATLRTLGYGRGYLRWLVFGQGFLLGVAGYVPGFLLAWVVHIWMGHTAGVPLEMTVGRACSVLIMALATGMLSAVAAVWIALRANPADLF